jgi:hypothetical protein
MMQKSTTLVSKINYSLEFELLGKPKLIVKRKNIHHLARNRAICNCYKEFAALRYLLFVT